MSVSINMTSADKRKFANDIKKFSKEAGRSVEESIARTAAFTASEAKKIVPVDKGFLKNSIRPEKKGKFTWEVATNIGYGLFVEFGTGPHEIRIKKKMALSNGKVIFGKKVMHPGTRAQPFLRPAFEKAKRKVFKELRQAFARR